jgi:hypothetical protein
MTALLAVVLLGVVAFGVDIATQVNQRQKLHDAIDGAAQAAAYQLPNSGNQANIDAQLFAVKNDPSATPAVDFFCVVASKAGSPWAVDATQIPATCKPTSAGGSYTDYKCNSKICSIPCKPDQGDACNTVRVSDDKDVPYAFAPVIGITKGSTGSVSSVACKGPCGTTPINPMDIAVVADRTGSMNTDDIDAMIAGIKGMFTKMTPSQQYVALGTIGRSKQGTAQASWCGSTGALSEPSPKGSETVGPWIPVPFSNSYLDANKTPMASSALVKGVECLAHKSSTGTHLASPMKAAARYLLGIDQNNLGSFTPARIGTVRKAIIFETDGQPNESISGGSTDLDSNINNADVGAGSDGILACANLKTVADYAKARGILIVTVAYNLSGTLCGGSGSPSVASVLAASASEKGKGVPSYADNSCSTSGLRATENGDGDFFFCGASNDDLAPLFETALGKVANGIRLIQLP